MDRLSPPIDIQRPSSALHAGDFTQDAPRPPHPSPDSPGFVQPYGGSGEPFGTSPTTPWYNPSSSFRAYQSSELPHLPGAPISTWVREPLRSRAPSINSYSSSYILKAPTSPLVQQSNHTDLEFSSRDHSPTRDRINRRHTLPPQSSPVVRLSPNGPPTWSSQDARHGSPHLRDSALSVHRSRNRRSLTSNWSLQVSTGPHSPGYLGSRRTSYSETSPLHNASMVGSFEESILRGSMSTAPSKPLDFTAQIGVLGKGNCKPKCPAHVIVPFPAVFYSWGGSLGRHHSLGDDEPSPYVGHIDLQSSLSPPERRRERGNHEVLPRAVPGSGGVDKPPDGDTRTSDPAAGKSKKRRRSPPPALAPPGGSYRIPQQGQLQIIIKNPNKTAVKLFLVPYDLTGMEPDTKTFLRQRCYSTELVDDGLIASQRNPGHPGLLSRLEEMKKKPTLRYLIHLNICSPSQGRFFLYQHIRVVFANRVPDNKEQLQNEIQVPQPRFSPYRPAHDTILGSNVSASARLTNEKAYRRRSSGWDAYAHVGGSDVSFNAGTPAPPIPAMPFDRTGSSKRRSQFDTDDSRPTRIGPSELMEMETEFHVAPSSPVQSPPSKPLNHISLSSSYRSNSSNGSDGYGKLKQGDSGYGGVFFHHDGASEGGEGLLARKLKGLGVRRMERMDTNDNEGEAGG